MVAVKDVEWVAVVVRVVARVKVADRVRVAAGWAGRSRRVRAGCACVRSAGTRRRTWRVSRAVGRCARSAAAR